MEPPGSEALTSLLAHAFLEKRFPAVGKKQAKTVTGTHSFFQRKALTLGLLCSFSHTSYPSQRAIAVSLTAGLNSFTHGHPCFWAEAGGRGDCALEDSCEQLPPARSSADRRGRDAASRSQPPGCGALELLSPVSKRLSKHGV